MGFKFAFSYECIYAFPDHRMHTRICSNCLRKKRKIVEWYYAKFYLYCGI